MLGADPQNLSYGGQAKIEGTSARSLTDSSHLHLGRVWQEVSLGGVWGTSARNLRHVPLGLGELVPAGRGEGGMTPLPPPSGSAPVMLSNVPIP